VSESGRQNSEQRIVDAATHLFAIRGYSATGIRQIADEVGVTTAALYYYARTKDDLLLSVIRAGLEELLASARRAVRDAPTPDERLRRLVAVHVEFSATDPERARVIDNEFQWLAERERRAVIDLRDDYEALWKETIVDGVKGGQFRTVDPTLARLALLEMCNGPAHWYRPDGPMTLPAIVAAFEDMALSLLGGSGSATAG
jgi:AcrR family transcriptional regulator